MADAPVLTPILIDAPALRDRIHARVINEMHSIFPVDLKTRTLEVKDVAVHQKDFGPEEQKRALMTGASLNETIKGTLVLKDKATGNVIDEAKNFILTHIPYFTERHTVISNGNEYQIANMLRRRPGVYTQRAGNGELHTSFNLSRGANFDLSLHPEKGTLHISYDSTNLPLYSVLRALGTSHEEIANHIGSDVANLNATHFSKKIEPTISKIYAKVIHPSKQLPGASHETKLSAVKEHFANTAMDPHVTNLTLGQPFDKVTPKVLMLAAKKLLDVHTGKKEVDDSDSLAFKTFHSVDDFLAERLRLTARTWAQKARYALHGKDSIRESLRPAPFSDSIERFVTTSPLTAIPMGINPIDLLDHAVKVTSLGEGGIPSERAIPEDARLTHATHYGTLDGIRTPESFHAGVDVRASIVAHRDNQGNLYTPLLNVKTGKREFVKSGDLTQHVVAFPYQEMKGEVDALVNGKITRVPHTSVAYQVPHEAYTLSPSTSLVPFLRNMQGNRAIMGAKMQTQSLPLLQREAPLVQVVSHIPGKTFEELYGHMVVPTSPIHGTVEKIDENFIYIKPRTEKKAEELEKDAGDKDLVRVPYQTNFPFPSKTALHHTLSVHPGDKVTAGQALGDSNYTRDGILSLGKNLTVAYVPYYGLNSNDAVVISEGAAQKLTSEHMYREVLPITPLIELSQNKHHTFFGAKYQPAQYAHLDENGIVKKGAKVNPHDLLVSGVTKTQLSGTDLILGRISKSLTKPFREIVLTWEHTVPGEIIEVVRSDRQVAILIKTQESMQIGDKLSGRHGNKGVVARIIPDHEMLQDAKGKPVDALFTSAGVVSRINPSQIIETAVAKVAAKIGKSINYDPSHTGDTVEWVKGLMKKHGVEEKEHLYDPVKQRTISGHDGKGVFVGPQYIFKLFKSTDTNFSGHAVGPHDLNEQPVRQGGEEGAKAYGKMEFDALLAHNARNIIQEAATIRGQKNDEFWKAIQLGLPLPSPKPTFIFNKFVAMLEGAGVKVDKRGSKINLLPLTDKDVLKRSAGAIENNKTLIAKNLKPEPGGLFDLKLTGGPQGGLYSHIVLHEPIVHPVFEEPVRKILGMTEKKFRDTLHEKGGAWFKKELAGIDVDKRLTELRSRMKVATGSELNGVVQQIKYLTTLQKEGLKPHEAYIISHVPVVPPVFRPIVSMPNDPSQLMVSDANKLYSHLIDMNQALKTNVLPSATPTFRSALYNAVGSVFGTHESEDDELRGQNIKGFLTAIAGKGSPKYGFFQRKMMFRTQDVSGRGTAAPDGGLGMDQIGLPEDMLWRMLDKLIVSRLVRQGYGAVEARELVDKKAPTAHSALMAEIKERPFIFNRAPTLHRYSVVSAYAVPVQGKTIRVNPFVEKGLNLDYDGDATFSCVFLRFRENSLPLDVPHGHVLDLTDKEAHMAARLKEVVGYRENDKIMLCNLADFPHGEELFNKEHRTFYRVPSGIDVVAFDASSMKLSFQPVTLWSKHERIPVEIVQLASSRQLVTDDDPRAVYGIAPETLILQRARPSDSSGLFVPVGQQFSELSSSKIIEEIVIPSRYIVHDTHHRLRSNIPLNGAIGRAIGTLVGDGWVIDADKTTSGVALASVDDSVAESFKNDIGILFVDPVSLCRTNRIGGDFGIAVQSVRYVLSSRALAKWVLEMIGKGAKNKHLPPFFLFTSRQFRLGLLAGLLDTDGSIAVSRGKTNPQWMINYTSISLRLCQELVWLSRSLGVTATISSSRTPKKEPCWQVTFSTPEFHQLRELPCANKEKAKRLNEFFSSTPPRSDLGGYTRQDPIPTPSSVAEYLATQYETSSSGYVSYRKAVKTKFVSRFLAKSTLTYLPTLRLNSDPLLQRWISIVDNTAIRWDHVVSYEKTGIAEDGYDLTVPGYETFMNVEGVILSNTLQIHAPITPAAIADAKKMMLPNMLLSDQRRDKLMAFPQHESILGITLASTKTADSNKKTRVFDSHDAVIAAYRKGEIQLTDPIEVKTEKHAEIDPLEDRPRVWSPEEAVSAYPPDEIFDVCDENERNPLDTQKRRSGDSAEEATAGILP